MNINRNNYEEFFLLYADKELSAAEKLAVDAFVEQHPDLKEELDMLLQAVLPAEEAPLFTDREVLFRTTDTESLVNMTNYESFFVRYTDDELSNAEKAATENFVYHHPECQPDFELIQLTRMQLDTQVHFPGIETLYRHTSRRPAPVIGLWIRLSAAAILLLLAGLYWLKPAADQDQQPRQVASRENSQPNKVAGSQGKETAGTPAQQPATQQSATSGKDQDLNVQHPANPAGEIASAENKKQTRQTEYAAQKSASPLPGIQAQLPASNEGAVQSRPLVADNSLPVAAVTEPAKPEVKITGTQKPEAAIAQTIYVDTDNSPAAEDYVYVGDNNLPSERKKPLRGLLRKASRVIEQNNPLNPEKKKSGVFTASFEQ